LEVAKPKSFHQVENDILFVVVDEGVKIKTIFDFPILL
jgi:hypothetical protein